MFTQFAQQIAKRRLGERDAPVGRAVGDVQISFVDVAADRKDNVAHIAMAFVILLRFEDRIGQAGDHARRIVRVKQRGAGPIDEGPGGVELSRLVPNRAATACQSGSRSGKTSTAW